MDLGNSRGENTPEADRMISSNTQEIPGKTIVDFFGVVCRKELRQLLGA